MQHLKEFLTRIQTFNLRIAKQKIYVKEFSSEQKEMDGYDLTYETQYYDSFSFKSELRVLKDMALIDLLTQDKERLELQLTQLQKVGDRFKQIWKNYHNEYREYNQIYKASYLFTIDLDDLFIVHNLLSDYADIVVSPKFVEDLGDSLKLRERFLKELIRDVEKRFASPKPERVLQDALFLQSEPTVDNEEPARPVNNYPTFTAGTAVQLLRILKDYFVPIDYPKLEKLLLTDEAPETPLIFRGNGNQLADVFKQLFDARMIVGCQQADLEKWIAPKFTYLYQGETREFTEGYLNDLISTKGRPCKSPILKIERRDDQFLILPTPRNKR